MVDSGASTHMLSKKVLSSDEMETLRRSRTPTRVVTANEAVQTHEQAQVFAHDLDLFVTVQILDDTSAVLSLRKLSEEHGYTYEWVSGHKPHLTKQEEEDFMQDGKSRTSCCLWIVVQFWYQFVLPQDSSSLSSTSPATERSDDPAPGNYRDSPKNSKQKKEDYNRDSEDRLRDLPEWLEEFTENLEDTEVLAPAHISHDSDSERPTKVAPKEDRKKRSKLRNALANQGDKGSLQKTHWRSSASSRKVW